MRDDEALWIFGYGSLIWRPSFDYAERRPGWVEGWTRRFWQSSTDHRGVPGAPGRVVTLVRGEGERCWGMAYRVTTHDRDRLLAALDHREKGGYSRHHLDVHAEGGSRIVALTYVATEANPEYAGPAPTDTLARQILDAHGPSGSNLEYLLRLEEALRSMGADDPHVFELALHVRLLQARPQA